MIEPFYERETGEGSRKMMEEDRGGRDEKFAQHLFGLKPLKCPVRLTSGSYVTWT